MKTTINNAGVLSGFHCVAINHRYNFNTLNLVSDWVIETRKIQFSQFFYPLLISMVLVCSCLVSASAEELPLSVSPTIAAPGQTVTINGVSFQNGARALVWGGGPFVTGSVETPGHAVDVAIAGNYAYVADGESGLQVIDITDPLSPMLVGSANTSYSAHDLAIAGNYAYVLSSGPFFNALELIDISHPHSPALVGRVDNKRAHDIAIAGNYAYIAVQGGLQVIDISNPQSPVVVGSADISNAPFVSIAIADNIAYLIQFGGGSYLIDITDPQAPVVVGYPIIFGQEASVAISGNYAYVVVISSGLRVVDISNPQLPVVVGIGDINTFGWNITIADSYAYVTAILSEGLRVIDISNPQSPVLVGIANSFSSDGFAIAGNYAYLTDSNGLSILPSAISSRIVFNNLSTLEVVLPSHLPDGTYDVTVLNPDGTLYKSHNAITITGTPVFAPAIADIDGSEDIDALTDGILLVRHLFGFTGEALTRGVMAPEATRSAFEVESFLNDNSDRYDIDLNGVNDALTDGILFVRYLFGFRGTTLINGAVAPDAALTTAVEIEARLQILVQ